MKLFSRIQSWLYSTYFNALRLNIYANGSLQEMISLLRDQE